jgi:hypothetical protein
LGLDLFIVVIEDSGILRRTNALYMDPHPFNDRRRNDSGIKTPKRDLT